MAKLAGSVLKDSGIHLCPSDRFSTVNSYGLNELGFVDLTDPGVTTPNLLAGFHTPAVTIMLGDVGTQDDLKTPRPDTLKMTAPGSELNDDEDAHPAARHDQRCDLGFIDGHAEPMRLDQFYIDQNPMNKWFTPYSRLSANNENGLRRNASFITQLESFHGHNR